MLNDRAFLRKLDLLKSKEQFAKIVVLDWEENPIQDIVSNVISGNLNTDGRSAVRRTGSLEIYIPENENVMYRAENILSLNKKIKLEIGIRNTTDQYVENEIVWFKRGLFIITEISITHSTNGVNISLQLKDKMCLLNGDVGGRLPNPVTFDSYDGYNEKGEYIKKKIPIFQMIMEIVNHWGGEALHKILISDVDLTARWVMRWGDTDNKLYYYDSIDGTSILSLDGNLSSQEPDKEYSYGQDVGYMIRDFIYPNELVANAGDSITSVLDKIKNALGNFEYFYDVDGNFIFQEIKNYLNTSQTTEILENLSQSDYIIDLSSGKAAYDFEDSSLISSYSRTPQYSMIKNDFVIWGKRKIAENKSLPIRYHLAIDRKPNTGIPHLVFRYLDPDDGVVKAKAAQLINNISELPSSYQGLKFFRDADGNVYGWKGEEYGLIEVKGMREVKPTDWRTELYLQAVEYEAFGTFGNYYAAELLSEWPKLYDIWEGRFYTDNLNADFFLDFIDSSAAIGEFSIANIGRRTHVVTDNNINCLFDAPLPEKIISNNQVEDDIIYASNEVIDKLVVGGTSNAAFDYIKELLYQYTNYNETISIQCIPLYHLEPNTRITVNDQESGIAGDYMINNYSINLDIGGMMTISATKALQRI